MNKNLVLKIFLYILQPIAGAIVTVTIMSFVFSTISVVSKEDAAQEEANVYRINPFDSSDVYLESEIFQTIFEEYIYTVADYAKVELESSKNTQSENGSIDITMNLNVTTEPIYYSVEDLMKWGQYTELYESIYIPSMYEAITYFDKNIIEAYSNTIITNNVELTYDTNLQLHFTTLGEDYIPIYSNVLNVTSSDKVVVNDEGSTTIEETVLTPSQDDILISIIYYYEIGQYYMNQDGHGYEINNVYYVLEERYLPNSGETLISTVSSWLEYKNLMSNLISKIQYFGAAYNEYYSFINYTSNADYYIEFTLDGKEYVYQNEDSKYILDNPDNYHEFQDNYQKYFKFSFLDFEHKTNVRGIDTTLFTELNDMFYGEVEDMHIYIGISEGDLVFLDEFLVTYQSFNSLKNNMWYYLGIVLIGLTIWFSILFYLGTTTGKRKDGFYHLYLLDTVPTEISFLTILSIVYLYVNVFYYNYMNVQDNLFVLSVTKPTWVYMNAIAQGMGSSLIFTTCLYSLIRRVHGRNIWRNSVSRYVCMLINKIYKAFSKLFNKAFYYLNSSENLTKKILIPFTVGYLFNIIAGIIIMWLILKFGFWGHEREILKTEIYIGSIVFVIGVFIVDIVLLVRTILFQRQQQEVMKSLEIIMHENFDFLIDTEKLEGSNKVLADAVNSMGNNVRIAVEKSTKNERFKADLITNVSHDIKTPLTSIINYVDLIKRENIETEPIKGYIQVLEVKTQRLKHLTEDLVEASKISSGNITIEKSKLNLVQLTLQMAGEFEEKFEEKKLDVISEFQVEDAYIYADGRRMFRIMENVFQNIFKYALEGTRVYLSIVEEDGKIQLMIKNISANPLNMNADELMEQFIRGDVSRTTEGSGLGLFISKSLTAAQDGKFLLDLDGDLFKVIIIFPKMEELEKKELNEQ